MAEELADVGQRSNDRVALLIKLVASGDAKFEQLEELKVISREPNHAKALYGEHNFDIICQHAFDTTVSPSSLEALRILANALFLRPETRQILVKLGYAPKAVARLGHDPSIDEQLLCSRLLFFLTYDTIVDFDQLLAEYRLDLYLPRCLQRHVKAASHDAPASNTTGAVPSDMALTEILKLMYNLTHHFPDACEHMRRTIPDLLTLLHFKADSAYAPFDGPIPHLINLMLSIETSGKDTKHQSAVFQERDIGLLTKILESSLMMSAAGDMDNHISPIISLIRSLNNSSPPKIIAFLRLQLLPTDSERDKPLGQSDTLFSKLIRLSTSTQAPTLRTLVPQLMFEMSDQDPGTFVRNVGYGYASGFLMNSGIDTGNLQRQAQESGRAGQSFAKDGPNPTNTNFVTGQYLDQEPQDTGPPMTDEEKEREAEKLFVLFERLKKTGVVDVVNPVEAAAREGRFEEID